ncbi:MAG: hypothetical protein JWO19_4033 [Bryobacterales bacterium]|nr:hypothetical protein [Bryobacterales bacterium]
MIEAGFTITIGLMGWLLFQTYSLNGKVSALDSNMTETKDRVNRIATAIPSVAERVAQQEVKSPAKAVIVATKPVETAPNKWASTILVFDIGNAAVTSYSLPLAGQFDKGAYAKTRGAALATDSYAQSFQDLQTNLRNMQDTTRIADVIVPYYSFVLRSATAADYMATFKVLHGTDSARVKTISVGKTPITWQTINGELARHPERYQPTNDTPSANRDRRY